MTINMLKQILNDSFLIIFIISLALPSTSDCQVQKKFVRDSTEDVLYTIHGIDSLPGIPPQPAPNDFSGTYSTFKIGLGFNYDFTTYKESDVFKQQMDSAGLNLRPTFKLRDFRILGSGVLKTKRP